MTEQEILVLLNQHEWKDVEFKEAQAMKKEFKEMAFEAETGEMDEDECAENLTECKEILAEIQALGDE